VTGGTARGARGVIALALSAFSPLAVVTIAADIVAFGALLSAVLGALSLVTALFGLVAIALMLVTLRGDRGAAAEGEGVVGRFVVTRLLLVAAVAAAAAEADVRWLFWLMLSLTALVIVGEQVAQVLARYAAPYAAHIPGVREMNDARVPSGPLVIITTAAIVAGHLVVTTSRWFLPVHGVLVALAVALWAAVCIDASLRIRARQRFSRRLPDVLTRVAPKFVLHWDAPPGTAYQIGMWLPELERIGEPYFVLVRTARCFAEASAMTDRPVILRRRLEDVDACIVPSLRAVFYVNNAIKNAHLVRFSHLTHVQLNHGDSDKTPSFNPVFRMYDLDFVAGQAAVDRFAAHGVRMPAEMFRIVGRPQVRGIEVVERTMTSARRPTVLYAPTWAGFNDDSRYSSLPHGEQIVRALLARGCRVIFRPHPYSYRSRELAVHCRAVTQMLADDTSGTDHIFGRRASKAMSLIDCFNAADALISDVSSVVVDFLYSEKPLAMVAVSGSVEQFRQRYPSSRAAYVSPTRAGSIDDIDCCMDALLADRELTRDRRALKDYYLGDIPPADYFTRFVAEARGALEKAELSA
jgi:hypothetical protein